MENPGFAQNSNPCYRPTGLINGVRAALRKPVSHVKQIEHSKRSDGLHAMAKNSNQVIVLQIPFITRPLGWQMKWPTSGVHGVLCDHRLPAEFAN